MDSLVRMRYLFDSLQPEEQQKAIKNIATTRGPQWIMALIFNHFAETLHDNSEDHAIVAAIIKEISSVITNRETDAQRDDINLSIDNESDSEDEPVSIEEMPFVMISKIASYLNQNDYIHFMHSSRRILIGCHSPFSLYHLDVDHKNCKEHTVRSAASVHSLKFRDVKTATLDTAMAFTTNSKVERLTLIGGWRLYYTRNRFLEFIRCFPNIKCIDIPFPIELSPDGPDAALSTLPMMPHLKGAVHHFRDNILSQLQRSLILKHVEQIGSLTLHLGRRSQITSPDPSLCNLTELKVVHNGDVFNRQRLFEWIKHSSKLTTFSIEWSRSNMLSIMEVISVLIESQPELRFMEFIDTSEDVTDLMRFMGDIGNGLSMSSLGEEMDPYIDMNLNEDKEFKVRIRFKGECINQKQVQHEHVTTELVAILRGHKHMTINKLLREFNWSQSESSSPLMSQSNWWQKEFENDLGDFRSFVRNHDRFRVVDEGRRTFSVALIRDEIGERHAVRKSEGRKNAKIIIDELGHLVEILEGCNVRHFMVQIVVRLRGCMRISKDQKVEAMRGELDNLVVEWNEKYRVDAFYRESSQKFGKDQWCITFCNKDNPMKGGYGAHGLFIK